MAELDETARFALKIAPHEVIRWLLPSLDTDLEYRRWLDTETIAFPGEPKRRCDTVAELVSRSGQGPPWALVLEVEARPRASMLDRVIEYQVRLLRKLRHGPRRRDKYLVAATVLFLSGGRDDLSLKAYLPGTDLGMAFKIGVLSLASQPGSATLERVARGELGRSILVWVPLMASGGESATVQEWVRLAQQEPDAERQKEYAGLAQVFATWKGHQAVWQPALEDWNVERISIVEEWKAKARREEKRTDLLKVLRSRFRTEVPADLKQVIEQEADLEVLSRWFDAALEQPSLEAFRGTIQGDRATPAAPHP